MLNEEQIKVVADEVLRQTLGSSGYDHAEVSVREDHSGEESIFVTAHFRTGSHVRSGAASLDARVGLIEAMQERGERRFPYIDLFFPDDEFPEDAGVAEAAE